MVICQRCGIPQDANYFDSANIKAAPVNRGDEVELARYVLHPQYCGTLLYFSQYAEADGTQRLNLIETPGYQWIVLCNNQPRDPYLPTSLILNPWGANNLPVHLRLEEGCTVRLVVRKISDTPTIDLQRVGGRLQGMYWYNHDYGGTPQHL